MNTEVASAYVTIGAKTDGLSQGMGDAKNKLFDFKGSYTEMLSAIELGSKVFDVAKTVIAETAGVTVEYAAKVRELTRLTGDSVEESSKLIQAADDVEIEFGTLQSAMEVAIRRGFDPSIKGMAELSEKYLSIQDPIARSKFLMDTFGRSGADLGPLMAIGAKGIKDLGLEAEKLGLVLSEKDVKAAREFEIASDNLGDRLEALKVKIGNVLIPKLVDLMDLFSGFWDLQSFEDGSAKSAEFINNFFYGAKQKAIDYYDTAIGKSDDLLESISNLPDQKTVTLNVETTDFFDAVMSWWQSNPDIPEGHAMGGDVSGGTPILVGEQGPELFIPGANGSIANASVTADALGGGGLAGEIRALRSMMASQPRPATAREISTAVRDAILMVTG